MKGQKATRLETGALISGIIFGIIIVVFVIGLAPTVSDTSNTVSSPTANATLENVSADARSLYGLYDLVWAAGGLLFIVGIIIFSFAPTAKAILNK